MKKDNKYVGIVIGLFAVILVLTGYIIYDKVNYKDNNYKEESLNNQENPEQSKPTPDEIKTLLVTDKEAVDLYESVSWDPCSNQYEYYYKQDKILAKDMPKYLRQALAFVNTKDSHFTGDAGTIGATVEDAEKEYKKLFGKDEKLVFEYFDNQSEMYEKTSISYFDMENGKYAIAVGASTCPSFAEKEIVAIEKNITKNEIYVYEKVVFWKYTDGYSYEIGNVYSDTNRTKLIASNLEYDYNDSKIDEYADKLDTYKYTFKQDSVGNYNFISVEKVK